MDEKTNLLIVGGGPYGLAMAAFARAHDIDCVTIGEPMGFWKDRMPRGMVLRSGVDWHMDPMNIDTIESYLESEEKGENPAAPLSRQLFLGYAQWFQKRKGIEVRPDLLERLDCVKGMFAARLASGETLGAKSVFLAPGFQYFENIPDEFSRMFPPERCSHTCDLVEFGSFAGKRCLIIGGRQSAFEWAALIHESGAAAVDVAHRHDTPRFEPSDWSWVRQLVDRTVDRSDWYRRLPQGEREEIAHRFWAEGRLKLEPWLGPRVRKKTICIHPRSRVVASREQSDGSLEVTLDQGAKLTADHVIFATGYRVDMSRIPYLAGGNVLRRLAVRGGYPLLDEHFQSDIPGLFISSLPATQDFGPFFGFVVGAPAAAKVIGARLLAGD